MDTLVELYITKNGTLSTTSGEHSFWVYNIETYPPIPKKCLAYYVSDSDITAMFDPFYYVDQPGIKFMTYFSPVKNTIPLYVYITDKGLQFSLTLQENALEHPTSPLFVMKKPYTQFTCLNSFVIPGKVEEGGEVGAYRDIFSKCYGDVPRKVLYIGGDPGTDRYIYRHNKYTGLKILIIILSIIVIFLIIKRLKF